MNQMTEVANLCTPYGRRGSQFEVEYHPEHATIWGRFNPRGTPCFSLGLLNDIRHHDEALEINAGNVLFEGAVRPVHYYVVASRTAGIFNLGGDLALFVLLIKARDRDALSHYARRCIDCIYPRIRNYFSPTMTTISLVQGDALGGGFETALASDVIVAEESARLGLPEILFSLFPGMGALSLLSRRVGPRLAEQLVLSGRIATAAELHELGVIDVLAKDGEGEAAAYNWIRKNQKRRNGTQAVFAARQHVQPINREELDAIADVWVDAALRLEDKDLRMMARIVRSQQRRMRGEEEAETLLEAAA